MKDVTELSNARMQDRWGSLTNDQHVELLLVFGSSATGQMHPLYSWHDVFNWIKIRHPGMLKGRDYQHVLADWPLGNEAGKDMKILMEIHKYHRHLRGELREQ